MTINQVLSILYPVLFTFLTGFLTYVGAQLVKYAPAIGKFIDTKIGSARYNQLKAWGIDIWHIGDETLRLNPIIGDTVQAKVLLFETAIRKKVPGITDAEIEELRQAIAGEINKDKAPIVKAIEDADMKPIIITPTLVPKYYALDGVTELIEKPVTDSTIAV